MCYNCGCSIPDDDMGFPGNITEDTFKHLSEHWKKTLPETKAEVLKMLQAGQVTDPHLVEMFETAAKAWGQSVEEAKKNTATLLQSQIK